MGTLLAGPTSDPNSASVIDVSASTFLGKNAANESKVILPFQDDPTVVTPLTDLDLATGSTYNFWPGRYGDVVVDGADLVLSSENASNKGVYYIDGSLTLTNGARIVLEYANAENPAVLYVGNEANFSDSIIGVDAAGVPLPPRALQILLHGEGFWNSQIPHDDG